MKNYIKACVIMLAVWLMLWAGAAAVFVRAESTKSKQYRVDAERIRLAIEDGKVPSAEDYPAVTAIIEDDGSDRLYSTKKEYVIIEASGKLYRLEYEDKPAAAKDHCFMALNISMFAGLIMIAGALTYLGAAIIAPFHKISELPYELAKGGLNKPLKESRHKYFGKFLWGLDMLRQSLEQAEIRRLEQAKAEKTLLLSLSHDIKTPLAAIKLSSSALSRGLYTDKDKQCEIAAGINEKADEIEGYVGQIIKNSSDDFLTFTADNRQFYLKEVMERLESYYKEKLDSLAIEFGIEKYHNCIMLGDPDRLSEVLQNLIENAVKYGDGRYIKLSFGTDEDMILITVRNSGCTLQENELPHIFDSFWRGANSEKQQGSGLGLYICRRLMQLMNGDIYAEIEENDMCVTAVCRKA